ncbi:hypothetical protein CEXT_595511 [Caerostris extrusa]|uniref:Uncharacterized protein n=1 Tax=Caerostris extrusa TaxID=172846 RepID=A0AAV4Y2T0_CAEEX|nr:hypothetical protein CEXT_595511 [Caerostris extrusa]
MKMRIIVIVKKKGRRKDVDRQATKGLLLSIAPRATVFIFFEKGGAVPFCRGWRKSSLCWGNTLQPLTTMLSALFSLLGKEHENACHGRKDTRLSFLLKFAAGRLHPPPPPQTPLLTVKCYEE